MARPPQPLFLARQSYRRRRLGDAARLVPLLGLVLMLVPALWSDVNSTAGGFVYVFVVWGALIGIISLLSRPLGTVMEEHDRPPDALGEPEA